MPTQQMASLTTDSKLVEGGQVEVILKMENINATESGISVVKGKNILR